MNKEDLSPGDVIVYGPWYRMLVIECNVDYFWAYSFDNGCYYQLSYGILKFFRKPFYD